jgi:hypothetical protein
VIDFAFEIMCSSFPLVCDIGDTSACAPFGSNLCQKHHSISARFNMQNVQHKMGNIGMSPNCLYKQFKGNAVWGRIDIRF